MKQRGRFHCLSSDQVSSFTEKNCLGKRPRDLCAAISLAIEELRLSHTIHKQKAFMNCDTPFINSVLI